MIAAARGFHQRENKPFWWAHFDRLNNPVDEWGDQTDVFPRRQRQGARGLACPAEGPQAAPDRRAHRVLAAGGVSRDMYALYEPPSPTGLSDDPDRRGRRAASPSPSATTPKPVDAFVISERNRRTAAPSDQLPFALTPGAPLSDKVLRTAIDAAARDIGAALPVLPDRAHRHPAAPRAAAPGPAPGRPGPDSCVDDITAAVTDLDSSYLAVHGPPGTGKTHRGPGGRPTGRRAGWRVSVVAQSHAVVENLFTGLVEAGWTRSESPRRTTSLYAAPWQEIGIDAYRRSSPTTPAAWIGGTAWDFANPQRVPPGSLDLLVIEEAGQFNLANTIAVAASARNLLLLGDPQQLPQVSQGTHPEPVNESALGWLIEGDHTRCRRNAVTSWTAVTGCIRRCAAVSRLSL